MSTRAARVSPRLVLELARNDFHVRYSGSVLGAVWSFAQPVLTILLYLFIYQVGFQSTPPDGVPFVLWLVVGIAPWFYFVDGMAMITCAFREYSFLVKKVMFDVSVVPLIKLLSTTMIHVVVWTIVVAALVANGAHPGLTWLEVPYYFAAMFALLFGLGRLTAILTPFFRDLEQVVLVGLQFGFWITPVMWPIANAPEQYRWLLERNPVYYVVHGLRDALLLGHSLTTAPVEAAWFWGLVLALHAVGAVLFAKLRPQLADVL